MVTVPQHDRNARLQETPEVIDIAVLNDRRTPLSRSRGSTALRLYRGAVMALDAAIAGVAAALAVTIRFDHAPHGWYAVVPGIMPFFWVAVIALHRCYEDRYIGSGAEEFNRVLRSGLALFTSIAVFSFSVVGNVSRSIVLVSVPATVLGSLAARKLARFVLYRAREQGRAMKPTIIAGAQDSVDHLVELLQLHPDNGFTPVGMCVPPGGVPSEDAAKVPVAGTMRDVVAAVDRTGATAVAVVSHPDLAGHSLRQLSWALEERGVELLVSPGIVEVAGPRLSIRPVAGLSLLHMERPSAGVAAALAKATFDRVLALMALLALLPIMLAIAIAVRCTSSGPILFRQKRVGVSGRLFSIYKFRTMVADAENRLIDLRDQSEGNEVLFKLRADPRITRLGGFLRRFSLDELPQLINVLTGDMSLVGPRPPLPSEVAAYEPEAARRLRVRPGITGLWQVSGRSDLTWEQSLRLDLRYVDNWSMALDVSILWRTLRAVVQGEGAY